MSALDDFRKSKDFCVCVDSDGCAMDTMNIKHIRCFGPCMVEEVVKVANRRGIPYSPGCGSVTEIVHAQEMGCDLVKVFPAGNVGGPSFVKNILGPLPWAMVMCTGAVEPTEENLTAWAGSGVTAVGMGSKLFPKEVVKAGDWKAISDLCAKSLAWFKK